MNSSNTNEIKDKETTKTDVCVATPAKKYIATYGGNSSNSNAEKNNAQIVSPIGNKIVPTSENNIQFTGKSFLEYRNPEDKSANNNRKQTIMPKRNKRKRHVTNTNKSQVNKNMTGINKTPNHISSEPPIQLHLLEEGSTVLDSTNAKALCRITQPTVMNPSSSIINKLIQSQDYWHKVTVLNVGAQNKEITLLRIMGVVYPAEMKPVMCKTVGQNLEFIVRACSFAIDKLCRVNMTIKGKQGPTLHLRVQLGFAYLSEYSVNIPCLLAKVIKKRYNINTKHLDLSSFHRDPDLENVAFCPLCSDKHVEIALRTALDLKCTYKSINLADNFFGQINACSPKWPVEHLEKIDLRHNKISFLRDVSPLKAATKLKELWLDQNPVCEKYDTEDSYIKDIQEMIPTLTRLDGCVLPTSGFPRHRKNFLQEKDDNPLADQFLRYYFTLYDSNRIELKGLYHKEALFSLTANFLPGQNTSNTARLTEYVMESRNLRTISEYSRSLSLLHHGPHEILKTLIKLPRSEHDPYSLKVDIIHYLDQVKLSVSGVFKEPAVMKAPLIRSFSRVFVLTEVAPKEYQIVNELLNVRNATSEEAEEAFKVKKPYVDPVLTKPKPKPKPELQIEADKIKKTEVLSKLSKMNMKWSRKCLDETNWDVTEALIVFTELYKMSKIPEEAFFVE